MTHVADQYALPTIPGPDPSTKKPNLKLPPGSCDCHAHLFGLQSKYPYAEDRRYTPHDGPLETYLRMLPNMKMESVRLWREGALRSALKRRATIVE